MKRLLKIFVVVLVPVLFTFPQEERKVLVEVFTNSHCPLCPPAHTVIDNYLAGPNGSKINFIFYHMIYPYQDDSLYHHNPADSDGRDDYYNPVHATPRGFFEGQIQGSSSTWTSILDTLVTVESPLMINLSGTKMNDSFSIKAEITRTGDIPDNDLVIHFVVVENVNYTGRNGISLHKNVMRDMIDGATGYPFSINMNETLEEERLVTTHNKWIKDSLKVLVFIQSHSGKTVYQSAVISYSEFDDPTGVGTGINLPGDYKLEQNYPNPFNPSTKIIYHLPEVSFVTLKIYNLLGKEISTPVNRKQSGGSYEVGFSAEGGSASGGNAGNLSSGIYFYKLAAVNSSGKEFVQTKKMILIK
jgi:hypothetical protein